MDKMTGDDLREALAQMGMTPTEFAAKVGYTPMHVWRLLKGKSPIPQPVALLVGLMMTQREEQP